jgi:hypothetical protein
MGIDQLLVPGGLVVLVLAVDLFPGVHAEYVLDFSLPKAYLLYYFLVLGGFRNVYCTYYRDSNEVTCG